MRSRARTEAISSTARIRFSHSASAYRTTTFEIGTPQLSAPTIRTDSSVEVVVEIRNTGKVAGDEVVQLYLRDVVSSVTRPVKELKGFERVTLKPGETKTVTFTLGHDALGFWKTAKEFVVEPGKFDVTVGGSSAGGMTTSFELKAANVTKARTP